MTNLNVRVSTFVKAIHRKKEVLNDFFSFDKLSRKEVTEKYCHISALLLFASRKQLDPIYIKIFIRGTLPWSIF